MKEKNLFSIVIPVYQVEHLLPRCIESILSQNCSDCEIILIDDGSQDRSGEICDRYANEYSSLIKVIHQSNKGLSGARNSGIKIANGKYIIFIDSDDSIKKSALDELRHCISSFSELPDMIALGFSRIEPSNSINFYYPSMKKSKVFQCREFLISCMTAKEYRCEAWSYAYKREFLSMNNIFFKEGIYHEDLEWNVRLLKRSPTFAVANTLFYNYIIREGSITTGANRKAKIKDLCDIYKSWYEYSLSLSDKELRSVFSNFFVKNYIYSFANYRIQNFECTWYLKNSFILANHSNLKELIREIIFVTNRDLYYRLFAKLGH